MVVAELVIVVLVVGSGSSDGSLFIHIDLLYSFIMYVHDMPRRIVYRNSHCMHACVSPRRI